MQARVHAAMGNLDLAMPILTGLRNLSKDDRTKREAQLSGSFYAQKKDAARAIQAWLDEVALGTDDQAEDVRARIESWPTRRLTRRLLSKSKIPFHAAFPGDVPSLRLIDLYINRGEEHQAIRQIQQFLVNFPTHPQADKTSDLLTTLQAKLKSNQFFIAAVLPLSRETRLLCQRGSERHPTCGRSEQRQGGSASGRPHRQRFRIRSRLVFGRLLRTAEHRSPPRCHRPASSKNLPAIAKLAEPSPHSPDHTDSDATQREAARQLPYSVRPSPFNYKPNALQPMPSRNKDSADSAFCIPTRPTAVNWPVSLPRKYGNTREK